MSVCEAPSLAGATVAVTGATGFIGRHLVAALRERGATVHAIQRPGSRSPLPPGVTAVQVPLAVDPLREALGDAPLVVHLAGVVSSPRAAAYGDVNVDGTRAVAAAARAAGAYLVHVSSLAAAGPAPAHAPRTEADPVAPLTPYGLSKLRGEQAIVDVAGADLDWTILRPGAVYGPGDRAMLPLFHLVRQPVVPFVGAPGTAFTFVHVRDLVTALLAALERRPTRETLFVGHPEPVGARQLLDEVAAVLGARPRYLPVPVSLAGLGAHLGDLVGRLRGQVPALNRARFAEMTSPGFVCRVDRLRERLGVVAAIDLRPGLAETADWYRREGWIT